MGTPMGKQQERELDWKIMRDRSTLKNLTRCKSEKLKNYQSDLLDNRKKLVVATGLPYTGKTKQAIEVGIHKIQIGEYQKLIICRPVVVPACGLLPGALEDKMSPYTRQSDVYIQQTDGRATLQDLIEQGRAEVIPIDLLQGNRFSDCFVVFDEIQNVPESEAYKVVTRLGENTKMVFLGDIATGQSNKRIKDKTLLHYLNRTYNEKHYCGIHSFYDEEDILAPDETTKDIIITLMKDFAQI